jgi:hypothetical protein
MGLKKQEFYEGAALHLLVRSGDIRSIRYDPPLFTLNGDVLALMKYSTKGRSPWGFTFLPDEQDLLHARSKTSRIIIALVCGSDGVAGFSYESYLDVAPHRSKALHIACYRKHGEHYEVCGPEGPMPFKVAPSAWRRILASDVTN